MTATMNFSAPGWLPGGNLQTIWPALFSTRFAGSKPRYARERWTTPDGDFIDVDRLVGDMDLTDGAPLLVLFHGLEGSSRSHYAEAFAHCAQAKGMAFAIPHFRGCSGELNHAPRAYHSGDYEEIDWILTRLRLNHRGPMYVVGVSLGGNALLRWAQEKGQQASQTVSACAAISAPVDLAASGQAIGRGFNKLAYTRMFLNTMKPKAFAKLKQHPGLFDAQTLASARSLYEFDNVFTAPLHGFKNTDDYWRRGSAKPKLQDIRVPSLVLNARNDPFVPSYCLPSSGEVGKWVTLCQPLDGGHVGFPRGAPPGDVMAMPEHVINWLTSHTTPPAEQHG